MRARDLQVATPTVKRRTSAREAGQLIAHGSGIGLVIANEAGVPEATVSATDVLRLMLPGYVLEDFSLAHVLGEADSEEVWENLEQRTIGELVDDDAVPLHDLVVVNADDTVLEIAAAMVEAKSQLALVGPLVAGEAALISLPDVMTAIVDADRRRTAPTSGDGASAS
ncbi:CBS domain-containing protein [Cryobacterium tepidiphilum]|jgi:CBS domain-containing protein|uniref:CBS domain-containing protein n=1 Tax=Cryobacterium tepidiphilum TaxID=2486026 RepID=A0A3M8LNC3_9MICO|nr:CBS domain-containing protein [Cryobacterium tepidiphilum]RNE66980.1 CBS domain-containing protein [Cryobacterium tepidiphilum]